MLHEFLESNRAEIIARTKVKVAARSAPSATQEELTHGVPLFFDQVIETLRRSTSPSDEMTATAAKHGDEMLRMGFTVGQVVHDYGDVCQAVTELAFERDAQITIDEFHTFNRCLDDVTAHAVTEYGRLREQSLVDQGTERLGVLAHELRNRLTTAMLSFTILKRGTVSFSGSTAALHDRTLKAMNDLVDRSLAEIRLQTTAQRRETIMLAGLVEEIEIAAIIEAKERGHQLTVERPEYGVFIEGDRQLIAAAVSNLLQNAFKFTREHSRVELRTRVTADRVFIDIEDECGGLPSGKAETLFRPFEQHGSDRSGLGLGLSISQKAVRASGGEIHVRDLPGKGCVFTIELPRKPGLGAQAASGHTSRTAEINSPHSNGLCTDGVSPICRS